MGITTRRLPDESSGTLWIRRNIGLAHPLNCGQLKLTLDRVTCIPGTYSCRVTFLKYTAQSATHDYINQRMTEGHSPEERLGQALSSLKAGQPEIAQQKVVNLIKSGRYTDSLLDELCRSPDRGPDKEFAKFCHLVGFCLFDNRNYSQSVIALSIAVSLEPENYSIRRDLFILLFDIGDNEGALLHYRKFRDAYKPAESRNAVILQSSLMDPALHENSKAYVHELDNVLLDTSRWLVVDNERIYIKELLNRNPRRDKYIVRMSQDDRVLYDYAEIHAEINEPCILLASHENFFHWLFDYFPRLALIEKSAGLNNLPLVVGKELKPYQIKTLEILSIDESRLIHVDSDQIIRCRKLHVPILQSMEEHHITRSVEWLRELFFSALPNKKDTAGPLVYISRSNIGRKHLLNESELIDRLKPMGFVIISPEIYSLERQVELVSDAKLIIGPEGSGLLHLIFAKPGVHVIDLSHSLNHFGYLQSIAEALHADYEKLDTGSTGLPQDASLFDQQMADFTIEVASVIEAVEKHIHLIQVRQGSI